jgi:dGTPase
VTIRLREWIEKAEDERLAPWATRARESQGRLQAEPDHPLRTAFQRDRDRVLHSRAFRRLQYKTQVFIHHEGDHFRNRLTHTLEVSQIGRTVARALGCNEDLCEAIVLSHDLGHTPFGHAGERAMHRLARELGGFEHNRQSLRVVDWLERRSERSRGLNLTHETRAGILKHGATFPRYPHPVPLPPAGASPGAEAQIADLCDEIAYLAHDVDDGLRSGLIVRAQLEPLELWREADRMARIRAGATDDPPGGEDRGRAPTIVAMIDRMVTDATETSAARLEATGVTSSAELRALGRAPMGFSEAMARAVRELYRFLTAELYRHPRVVRMGVKAERILGDLWQAYRAEPRLLPPRVLERPGEEPRDRAIVDYLASMTDRFAIDEHRRLFDPHAQV